jgi:hypothetical protein
LAKVCHPDPQRIFLTAVDGGGHNSGDAIHTDAVNPLEWEQFIIFRSSDFGTGSTYAIQAWGGPVVNWSLIAANGGNQPGPNALLSFGSGIPYWLSWTLLKQNDGTYAFQTASGYLLTAISDELGGGFGTDSETIGNWEKFTLVDNGDFTAYIKTYAGTYLAVLGLNDQFVTTVTNINDAAKFRFWVTNLGDYSLLGDQPEQ